MIKLFLDHHWKPTSESRVLHFAPERGLYSYFSRLGLKEYRIVDFAPQNFNFAEVEQFDLCTDGPHLPSNRYDLILHSHVMEHIPCNFTAVLLHIHRSLSADGLHLMCVPFMDGHFEEDLAILEPTDAVRRFGQRDHLRKFGKEDVARTLGMIFRIPEPYSLQDYFTIDALDAFNIPERERLGYTGTSVFPLIKDDCILASQPRLVPP